MLIFMMSEIMADNLFCSYKVAIFCVMKIIHKNLVQKFSKINIVS